MEFPKYPAQKQYKLTKFEIFLKIFPFSEMTPFVFPNDDQPHRIMSVLVRQSKDKIHFPEAVHVSNVSLVPKNNSRVTLDHRISLFCTITLCG